MEVKIKDVIIVCSFSFLAFVIYFFLTQITSLTPDNMGCVGKDGTVMDDCYPYPVATETRPFGLERTLAMGVNKDGVSLHGAFFNVYNESKIISTNSQMVCISSEGNNFTFSIDMSSQTVPPKEQFGFILIFTPLDNLQRDLLLICPFELFIAGEESLTSQFYLEVQ